MRRWNELKIWEKQYYKKRILIWAIVIVLLIAAAAAGFYVISHRPEAPQEISEKLEEYPWEDTFTGQPFRAVDDNFDETPLSENVSLVTVQVAYQNGKRDTREFVWWKTQEPDLWFNLPAEGNCQSGAYIQRSKQNGEESELYTSDFFILYGMGYYDGSAVVFCVVSADPDVHDTAGSEVIQIKRDNLYYSYMFTDQFQPGYAINYKKTRVSYENIPFTPGAVPEDIYRTYVEAARNYQKSCQSEEK